ncbi:MarR family winged helix-turn-helix transcriptional regulator [Pollutimonas bauzanensis]|uniref:DNA-binding transcriptional regulator, MarR family n=1 Tax=Pollutimonas bauzanensis TaxID=658167 RepID=A0A1M5QEM0_9BURK|nr:MarR family transcriptional regulator [Pollutimonas bauzanensis]SHH12300.1 DNA-binding transcriptional regulator, MarR family [Pollutimonas bauzanensis]
MAHNLSDILDGVAIPMAYKLGYMINSYREPSFRAIEAEYGLTRSEILSLIFLYFRDGIAAADICDFSGHLKTNISRAVTALEKKKLITRKPHLDDQRRQLLYITGEGRKMHDLFMPGLVSRERDMVACLSGDEQEQLATLLRKLCAHAPAWNSRPLALERPPRRREQR